MKLKRILLGLPIAIVVIILTSSARPERYNSSSYSLTQGDIMPTMNTADKEHKLIVPPAIEKGYTLVHFWASYDAESRAKNIEYNHFFDSIKSNKIIYRDISLDPDTDVYNATEKIDKVNANTSICVASSRDDVIRLYRLEDKPKTFLIDHKGRICKIDPTKEELKKYVTLN